MTKIMTDAELDAELERIKRERQRREGLDNVVELDRKSPHRRKARAKSNAADRDDETVAALAELSDLAYQKRRAEAAQEMGIGVGVLDKLVRKRRARAEEDAAELPHWNVEPWGEAVDGATLLADIEAVFRRYIVSPKGAVEALALWTLHTWTMDAGDISPFMVLISPTKRCGKTNVLIILHYLTPRSELASNISASALFRYIEEKRPTLLIDEADSFVKDNEEMRGILNSGHTKAAAHVIRNVEVNGEYKPRRFLTWAPKAIATIRSLADTLEDRSIIVQLQRKPRTATVARLRKRDSEEFATLRRRAARWAADNFSSLADPDPAIPHVLNDRAADNWRPLLAIADLAGDAWARRARDAACILSGEGHDSAVNVELLADIKTAFGDHLDAIFSADLVTKLTADPERPWAEWNRGKPLSQKQLAGLLKPFGIISQTVHPAGRAGPSGKGYKRASFEEAWAAYLAGQNTLSNPNDPSDPSTRPHADGIDTSCDSPSVHGEGVDGSKNANLSYSPSEVDGWTDQKPPPDAESEIDQGEGPPAAAGRTRYELGRGPAPRQDGRRPGDPERRPTRHEVQRPAADRDPRCPGRAQGGDPRPSAESAMPAMRRG
jgi:putative DNA primase/helicase